MRVDAKSFACVGFAGEAFEPLMGNTAGGSTAWVHLGGGTTCIFSGLSLDGQEHSHSSRLARYLPNELPFDLALHCDPESNVPQVQFNEDGIWHDFAPQGRKTALKSGPWFPYLVLNECDCLSNLRVNRLKATKSAGKTCKDLASQAACIGKDMPGALFTTGH
jgi:hypothetical protein